MNYERLFKFDKNISEVLIIINELGHVASILNLQYGRKSTRKRRKINIQSKNLIVKCSLLSLRKMIR